MSVTAATAPERTADGWPVWLAELGTPARCSKGCCTLPPLSLDPHEDESDILATQYMHLTAKQLEALHTSTTATGKRCQTCRKTFHAKRSDARYCGPSCRQKGSRA